VIKIVNKNKSQREIADIPVHSSGKLKVKLRAHCIVGQVCAYRNSEVQHSIILQQ